MQCVIINPQEKVQGVALEQIMEAGKTETPKHHNVKCNCQPLICSHTLGYDMVSMYHPELCAINTFISAIK